MRSSSLSVEFHETKCSFSRSRVTTAGGTAVKAGVKVSLVKPAEDRAGLGVAVGLRAVEALGDEHSPPEVPPEHPARPSVATRERTAHQPARDPMAASDTRPRVGRGLLVGQGLSACAA